MIQLHSTLGIDGMTGVVVDKRVAAYRGAEGSLPFEAEPGNSFHGVDLRGYDGSFATLDYGGRGDHSRPVPYVGAMVDPIELGLTPLRAFEGWPRPGDAKASP
jgi:hypothetical protein